MKTVNRSVLVLRYGEPILRWVGEVSPEDPEDHSLREVTSVYLVPTDPEEAEESAPLDALVPTIFENELELWCTDRALWPAQLDATTEAREIHDETKMFTNCVAPRRRLHHCPSAPKVLVCPIDPSRLSSRPFAPPPRLRAGPRDSNDAPVP
jgi:hypothetical protein